MMKLYDEETRDADVAALAGDHRFGALLELLTERWEQASVRAGDPSIVSDHGQLAYWVGQMDCYRSFQLELRELRKHKDT